MEKLLVNAREVREMIGLSEGTFRLIDDFPKPVSLSQGMSRNYTKIETARNLWRVDEIRAWVNGLPKKR